ncbi:ABC transporter permease subunit [Calycomorphotria hydatis]|uniref:Phosphate transport system permease protein PstC n=1 Tax=Calycomorphotria hydatis TaxID=2528027 RepID=A0A517T710_9PLAN|nr:ABC transporter permease subunit [Calycomorphotria hydatis]QDT64164.1 Phosphate transport system permease protein PstC [Calycomorphotria hydatis]
MAGESVSFTGRKRDLKTRRSVKFADNVASAIITVGGIGTIVAVFLVGVFLLLEVVPLFESARLDSPQPVASEGGIDLSRGFQIDKYNVIGWGVGDDGSFRVFRPDNGETIRTEKIDEDLKITATAVAFDSGDVALGFEDGSLQLCTTSFGTDFYEPDQVPIEYQDMSPGELRVFDGGVLERTPQNQYRLRTVEKECDAEPIDLADQPIRLLDVVETSGGPVICAWTDDGKLLTFRIEKQENLFTGEVEVLPADKSELPLEEAPEGPPAFIRIGERGHLVYAVWSNGTLLRYSLRNRKEPMLAEKLQVIDPKNSVTACEFVVGRVSLLIGDSAGNLATWFPVRDTEEYPGRNLPKGATASTEDPADGFLFTRVHVYEPGSTAVSAVSSAPRSRLTAVGYEDGSLKLLQSTTEEILLRDQAGTTPLRQLLVTAQEERSYLYALNDTQLSRGELYAGYPEASLGSLFQPVWYEGYPAPAHVWQSSSASDAVEPKLGLWPIVFGTLKATLYSMLFGAPLALLAAIYASEIMPKNWRAWIKPLIENMASLPSVVLGFLAALIFAVIVEKSLYGVLAAPFAIPFTLLASAVLWQMIPPTIALRYNWARLIFASIMVIVGIVFSFQLGVYLEDILFGGNVLLWLSGGVGTGTAGWMFIMMPLMVLLMTFLFRSFLTPKLTAISSDWSRQTCALVDLLKFSFATIFVVGGAYLLSLGLIEFGDVTGIDTDPRGSFIGTYIQRNAFVVGIVMGFAIIPIIFTLADDALTAVPEQLRSASLGAGATPWQTAVRVVIPTAMSGLFSAMMVGLGRAVGETMIVLMAAGNTPVLDLNIFNGFRTLSANIAVELPEAVKGSTHYRTLFLCALILFAMTFVVNTLAELVRIRFRKRVTQL